VLAETPREAFVESDLHKGYRIAQTQRYYAGVAHLWLIVHSEELREAASERLESHPSLREKELGRQLSRLSHKTFACRADAFQAAEAFAAEHLERHHRLDDPQIVRVARYDKRGRPAKGAEPEEIRYRIKAKLKRDEAAIGEELERSGRYILATKIPSEGEELTNDELLAEYKGRQSVERGFRFLKDPLFFISSVFVKTLRRVAAIAMVMGFCLLVYAIGERSLREALAKTGATIRDQRGKPTSPGVSDLKRMCHHDHREQTRAHQANGSSICIPRTVGCRCGLPGRYFLRGGGLPGRPRCVELRHRRRRGCAGGGHACIVPREPYGPVLLARKGRQPPAEGRLAGGIGRYGAWPVRRIGLVGTGLEDPTVRRVERGRPRDGLRGGGAVPGCSGAHFGHTRVGFLAHRPRLLRCPGVHTPGTCRVCGPVLPELRSVGSSAIS
jgi:hypothetical protein